MKRLSVSEGSAGTRVRALSSAFESVEQRRGSLMARKQSIATRRTSLLLGGSGSPGGSPADAKRASVMRRASVGTVLQKKGWALSDDEADAIIIKIDRAEWQIGFAGEDAPREREEHGWGEALHPAKAAALLTEYLEKHCDDGIIPQNALLVLPEHCYTEEEASAAKRTKQRTPSAELVPAGQVAHASEAAKKQ